MPGLFQGYKVALLDSSFFLNPFPQDVQDGLRGIKVYVSDTFNAEIEQYKIILSQRKRDFYEDNIRFLHTMPLNTLNLASFGAGSESLHNDVWGLVTLFKSVNPAARVVVVTANVLLMQRLILHRIQVDIYSLNEHCFWRCADFDTIRQRYEFQRLSAASVSEQENRAKEGDYLYRENGMPIVLGEVINSGAESNLHRIQGTNKIVAKVFKRGKLSPQKLSNFRKLAGINDKMEISWALFPIDVLYYDRDAQFPAGFTEGLAASAGSDLSENPLYAGLLENLPNECLQTRLSENVDLCLKVVRQVCYLNHFGFLVSDYNMSNFAVMQNDNRYIQMWDTDSFGFDTYFSGYCAGDKTTKEYDTSTKEGVIDFCSEALYLFAFSLLSLGDTPMSEYSGKFKYTNPNYPFLYRSRLFPQELWSLFQDVFTGKKLPSAETLLLKLTSALEAYQRNPTEDRTIREVMSDIIPAASEQTPEPRAEPWPEPHQQIAAPELPVQQPKKIPTWVLWMLISLGLAAIAAVLWMVL